MKEELFFVGIGDPIEMRKDLLTSSKNLIDSLKRYEVYKTIKEDKLNYMMELKRVFDELLVLNKKLRNKMPKTPMKAPKMTKESKAPKKADKKEKTQIAVLETELSKIEEKLGKLE